MCVDMDSKLTLNNNQVALLELLYVYRFGSRSLVADSLGIKAGSSLHERLGVLLKHGYIGKRFEKSLKLQGVPIAYYLTPKGTRALQALPDHEHITDATIKASYKDKTVGQAFVMNTMAVYSYTNTLKQHFSSLKVFTQRHMSQYDYFPKQLPDAFLSLPTSNPEAPKRFFFDIITNSMPRPAIDRRISNYLQFFDEGGWDDTGSELPKLLLLCESGTTEKRVQRYVKSLLARSDVEELDVFTSTMGALKNMTDAESAVWTSIEDPDELLGLQQTQH
jgi:hypothetical protein